MATRYFLALLLLSSRISFGQAVTWEQANNGPYGDNVTSLLLGEDGALYASTRLGVFQTTDNGTLWNRVCTTAGVSCLVRDSTGCLFAGIGWPPGLLRSCDNGNQWIDTNIPYEGYGPNTIAVTSNGTVYVGKRFGIIFRSTDHGESWERLSLGLDVTIQAITVNSSGSVFAGTLGLGIYRSTDEGTQWRAINLGLPIGNDVVSALCVDQQSDLLYAGFVGGQVFCSSNNGNSWTSVGLPHGRLRCIAANGGNLLVGTDTSGVFRSIDRGISWQQFNEGLRDVNVTSLMFGTNGNVYAGTSRRGVFVSNGVESWHCSETGISNMVVQTIETHQWEKTFVGTYGDLFRSTNGGRAWQNVSPHRDSTLVETIKSLNNERLILSTREGLFISSNNGDQWIQAGYGLNGATIVTFALASSGEIYGGSNAFGVFKSTDFGMTWVRLGITTLYPWVEALVVNSVGHVFAGTWHGVFRSTNAGSSWSHADSGFAYPEVYSLAIGNKDNLFAGTISKGVYRSTDNGNHWHLRGLDSLSIYSLVHSHGVLYASALRDKIYRSTDEGQSWERIDDGLDDGETRAIALDSKGYLWAATYGVGIYRTTNPVMTPEPGIDTPTGFLLYPNYPNPFNPSTTIRYSLPHTSFVTLTVYNTLGQQVAQLVNEQQQAGYHDIVFRGDGLGSGVYFYRLDAGSFTSVKKLLLLK